MYKQFHGRNDREMLYAYRIADIFVPQFDMASNSICSFAFQNQGFGIGQRYKHLIDETTEKYIVL